MALYYFAQRLHIISSTSYMTVRFLLTNFFFLLMKLKDDPCALGFDAKRPHLLVSHYGTNH